MLTLSPFLMMSVDQASSAIIRLHRARPRQRREVALSDQPLVRRVHRLTSIERRRTRQRWPTLDGEVRVRLIGDAINVVRRRAEKRASSRPQMTGFEHPTGCGAGAR